MKFVLGFKTPGATDFLPKSNIEVLCVKCNSDNVEYDSTNGGHRKCWSCKHEWDEEKDPFFVDPVTEKAKELVKKFVQCDEFIEIEFDIEAGTATVKKCHE